MDKNDIQTIRDKILEAAEPHVAFDGWTWEMVVHAASEAGYSAKEARAAFPSGIADVLAHFADMADRAMLEALDGVDIEEMRVRDRVAEALMARYAWLLPRREAEQAALTFWAYPTRNPRALKIVWRTADCIWEWAGDTATDYNRYTKRTLLSAIIVPTTLVWVNDTDADMGKTRAFLERRIANVLQIGGGFGKIMAKVKEHCA